MPTNIGVDGCKAGWFMITRNGKELTWRVFPTVNELVSAYPDAQRIFIDVPIGLPFADVPIRPCDRLARQVLGKSRRSSVFPVPCREALEADGIIMGRKINQVCLGRSINEQTWGISPKIKEVDRLLRSLRGQDHGIREIHPEVCFWALNHGKPMNFGKTTASGKRERLAVLHDMI